MSRSISFIMDGDVRTRVTVTELPTGDLQFDLQVLDTGYIGDLRALFFDLEGLDVTNEALTVTSTPGYGGDITGMDFEEAGIDTLGKDANIKGEVSNALGDFDVGVAFGTAGMAADDIQQTSFVVSRDAGDLSLDMLSHADFAARYTSVGEAGSARSASAKIGDEASGVAQNDVLQVDEDEQATLNLLLNDDDGMTSTVIAADGFTTVSGLLTADLIIDGKNYGTMTLSADGTLTVTADGPDADPLAEGETVDHTFTYETVAPDGARATASVDVTVTGVSDGPLGFVFGANQNNAYSGTSVALAGDVNGDGISDIIIGAYGANGSAGETYVLFGRDTETAGEFDTMIYPDALDGSNGFTLTGIDRYDWSGFAVSSAGDVNGDVNGDGYDDILIGAWGAASLAGETYLVFGHDGSFPASIDLGALDGSNGYVLTGSNLYDYSGWSVSSAGDVNGDGIDDILIGAKASHIWNPDGSVAYYHPGQAFVVFGGHDNLEALDAADGTDGSIDLENLDGSTGFNLYGLNHYDYLGYAVSAAGDVNNDGFDDFMVSALGAGPGYSTAYGTIYVVYGRGGDWDASFDLTTLDGDNGFAILGSSSVDNAGMDLSGGGDVNGDGIADILIGAPSANPPGEVDAGKTFVVFGQSTAFDAVIDLATLDGNNGYVLNGIDGFYPDGYDWSGWSVASIGDLNGDGVDELLIGAYGADPDGNKQAGETYLVFGGAHLIHLDDADGSRDGTIYLENITAEDGFVFNGIEYADQSGYSVASAGDINNDGVADLMIAANWAEQALPQVWYSGETYVIYGDELVAFDAADGTTDGQIQLEHLFDFV